MATIYSNIKYLQFREHLDAIKKGEVLAPIHIRIKPINRCNHNCWYCAYRAENLKLGEDMDLDDVIPEDKMMEICDDIIEMGVKAVTFSGGGEPLIYKPLPKVIEKLATGGVKIASLTNGANLKGSVADAFAKYGTWVRISTDAWNNESYTKSRGAKEGEFDKLLENIKNFTARDTKCVLGISFIVSKQNYTHVYEMCKKFKELGVNHVKVMGAIIDNDVKGNNLYHSEIKDEVQKQIKSAQNDFVDDSFNILNHYHDLDERFEKHYEFCPFLTYLTVIGADSKVYTCQDKAYTDLGLLGSIKDKSFKEFWFSKENKERIYSLNPCHDCKHHCVAHGKNLSILEYLDIDPEHGLFV
jgi:MoaA/NifB/PqqE/SkfB family radical SAM enzyme